MKKGIAFVVSLFLLGGMASAFDLNININTGSKSKDEKKEDHDKHKGHERHEDHKAPPPPPPKPTPAPAVQVNVNIQTGGQSKSGGQDRKTFAKQNGEQNITVGPGTSVYVIPAGSMPRDWKWHKILFQVSSTDNTTLEKVEFSTEPGGRKSLDGYSKQVFSPDPGKGKDLEIHIKASQKRKLRINWWPGD